MAYFLFLIVLLNPVFAFHSLLSIAGLQKVIAEILLLILSKKKDRLEIKSVFISCYFLL